MDRSHAPTKEKWTARRTRWGHCFWCQAVRPRLGRVDKLEVSCTENTWTGPTPLREKVDKLEVLCDSIVACVRPRSKSPVIRVCGQARRPYEEKIDKLDVLCEGIFLVADPIPAEGNVDKLKVSCEESKWPCPTILRGKGARERQD